MEIISIPTRGNSKSIPLKNLSKLNNKPLIYYSIKQSLIVNILKIYNSTDNLLIAKTTKDLEQGPVFGAKKICKIILECSFLDIN